LLTEKKQRYEGNGPKGKICTLLDKKKNIFDENFLQLLPYGILNLFLIFAKKKSSISV